MNNDAIFFGFVYGFIYKNVPRQVISLGSKLVPGPHWQL